MRFLSLFAGIGGFDLGLERAGHVCVGQVEIDPFCNRILAARFNAPRWTDVREWQGNGHEPIDFLVGGFPCQDLSVAGKRAGLSGERSGLFWEIVRIARIVKPPWGLFENVPGILSSCGGADMWTVLAGLRECWPVVGYRILDSRYFGVPQRRRRVFFVCGPTEARVQAVLFEPEGGAGDSQASGEAGEGIAGDVARSITGTCFERHDEDTDTLIASTLNSGGNDGGFRTEPGEHLIAHSLKSEGADASEDGTGRGTPLVAATLNPGHEAKHSYPGDGGTINILPLSSGVRRLTPLECERLQGFPDGWTCLCGTDDHEMGCRCPDSPRYRTLGNAVTVNVIEWLGRSLPA